MKKDPDLFKLKRFEPQPCFKCRALLDTGMLVATYEDNPDLAGLIKFNLCRKCGDLAIWDLETNKLRRPSKAELRAIKNHPEGWGMVKKSRRIFEAINQIKQAKFN